ncbi:MAG: hypothetical protein HYV62_05210 [Candidatus Rokubacteria bacterium]|nr:hypothetical protein [Candidatus Rokubacteria bacterium]
MNRGEARAAGEKAEAALELARAHESVIWVDAAMAVRACLLADERLEDSVAALEGAMARSSGWRRVIQLCLLAELCGKHAEADRGLAHLDEALALVQRGVAYAAPEVHRLRGELLLARGASGDRGDAEAAFRRAIEIARAREERSLELRVATSLARLLLRDGRREEARRTLGETYGWFTEGFDTRDLKTARALLDELEEE